MNKQLLVVVVAAILALGGFLALVTYARGADERAFEGTERVTVLRVIQEVPAKTPASTLAESVETAEIPKAAVVPGAVTDLAELDGLVTRGVLVPGDQLSTAKFAEDDKVAGDSALPKGMQELTIPIDGARLVGGAVVAGDRVGVIASYEGRTATPINQLLVLNVDTGVGEEGSAGTLVTFAIKARDAKKVVNAMEFGKVWLTKQNEDTDTDGGGTVSQQDVAP